MSAVVVTLAVIGAGKLIRLAWRMDRDRQRREWGAERAAERRVDEQRRTIEAARHLGSADAS